jgi:4-hydroxythreonine-4-phosphate dehydrogenase
VGITLGDPAGIGPEIVRKALVAFEKERSDDGVEIVVIGADDGVEPGKPSMRSAQMAFRALEDSVRLLRAGVIQAVVNAPVHKAELMRAGFRFPGQTEFYATASGLKPSDVTMTMVAPRLAVGLATAHCSLARALRMLNADRIAAAGKRVLEMLRARGIPRPRIAVAGLNPHAGEDGAFGKEEQKFIDLAVKRLGQASGDAAEVSGPHPPDTVFRSAFNGAYDAVIALYHDQGLIPFKLMAFEEGVNVTAGLSFFRCSPDHGTAFDIAGKGIASHASMLASIRLAAKYAAGIYASR